MKKMKKIDIKKSIIKNELNKINRHNNRRFHMPGHKGRGEAFALYDYDITEIPGADNLHDAQGIIAQAQEKLAAIYQSDEAAILVNGTTTGIHSAILGSCAPGAQLLVPINCHRAVFGALGLGRIDGVFITPEIDKNMGFAHSVSVVSVRQALAENPQIGGMILTNPSYYGTTSDIAKIAETLHDQGKFLIVDEAHGAHLHFSDKLPQDALSAGADVVIQSTHKILGSLTQSSLIHFQGSLVDRPKIKSFLSLLQSSSPSYPLMISVEEAVDAAYEKGEIIFNMIVAAHREFCQKQNGQEAITLYNGNGLANGYDRSKWLFQTRGIAGTAVAAQLSAKYGIQCEMSSANHVLAMTGIGTNQDDLARITQAICDINKTIKLELSPEKEPKTPSQRWEHIDFTAAMQTEMPLWEALASEQRGKMALDMAVGQLVGDFIIPYPPGIPVLLPGSRISPEMAVYLNDLLDHQVAVVGIDANRAVTILKKEPVIMEKNHQGQLIVIEGVDGSGKQTQTQLLYDRLVKQGEKVMKISYPRYDKQSSAMVKLYLEGAFGKDPGTISPYIASTFYAADRYASYKEDYEDFLTQGGLVLVDRYTTSNMVHQAGKIKDPEERKRFLDWLWDFEFNLYGLPIPDRVFFLNIPPEINQQLIKNRNNKITGKQQKDIHENSPEHLRDSYRSALALVAEYGWTEINCVQNNQLRSIESIHEEIWECIKERKSND
jgi:arginine/lysine/ornithine decarboxylase/thymidylate kinase